jgi:hypothetical protein
MARVVMTAVTRGNGGGGNGAAWPVINGHDGWTLLVEGRGNRSGICFSCGTQAGR